MKTQKGFTLIELMVALAIALTITAITAIIYINSASHQRALIRQDESLEAGAYAMQVLGREIMKAGFYPSHFLNGSVQSTQSGMYETYPPLPNNPRSTTDWQNPASNWPPRAYQTGIYGCSNATFNIASATCPAAQSDNADSLVVNYFTFDAKGPTGSRRDCTGSDVANDPSNADRKNSGNTDLPPAYPLFVSNRYTLSSINIYADQNAIATKSLACSGNGSNKFGENSKYQPIISGLVDMSFSYSVYSEDIEFLASKFYTATEIENLASVNITGQLLNGWQRVIAIKACILSETLGGGNRLTDPSGATKKYTDCRGNEKNLPNGKIIHKHEKIFGVRNKLNQSY